MCLSVRRSYALLALTIAPAVADIVYLADGSRLEGTVTDLGEALRVERGPASLTIPKRRVLRLETAPTPEARYAARAAEVASDDADGRVALAAWCQQEGMPDLARDEYKKALAIDPDHEAANRALGRERIDGRWMTHEEAQTARGLAWHEGRWMTVEERDARLALKAADATRRAAHDAILQAIRRAALSSDAAIREAARDHLASFPAADRRRAAVEALSAGEPKVRAVAAETLIPSADATCVVPLVRRSVLDASPDVRRLADDALMRLKDPGTGAAFLDLLQSGNIAAKVRAAEGLAAFPERLAIPSLIAVLDYATEPPAEISLTVAGPGATAPPGPIVIPGGGLTPPPSSPGGRIRPGAPPSVRGLVVPRVVTSVRDSRDPVEQALRDALIRACIRALRACTGQDFGASSTAWKTWWTREAARPSAPGP